jgi:predicted transcriptional regulator
VLQVKSVSRSFLKRSAFTVTSVFIFSQKVNEKPQVINDYEAGRGIPNQVVIGKIERAIGKWPF